MKEQTSRIKSLYWAKAKCHRKFDEIEIVGENTKGNRVKVTLALDIDELLYLAECVKQARNARAERIAELWNRVKPE